MKTCKKLGKMLLCASVLTAAMAVPAFAAEVQQAESNVEMTVSEAEITADETVTVTISSKEAVALAGLGFYLDFDETVLECTKVELGNPFPSESTEDIVVVADTPDGANADGIYSYGVATAENTNYEKGTIVTLTFKPLTTGTANFILTENSATEEVGVGFKDEADTDTVTIVEAETGIEVEAFGGKETTPAYTTKGQKVTVTYNLPCKVGYLKEGSYVALTTDGANSDGDYDYTAPAGVNKVIVVVKGDTNGDGEVKSSDYGRLNAALLGKTTLTTEAAFAADVNDDDAVKSSDYGRLNAVLLGKTTLNW